ncbi:MAG: BON domain-containing protein [Sandaracinaceae bacterium]
MNHEYDGWRGERHSTDRHEPYDERPRGPGGRPGMRRRDVGRIEPGQDGSGYGSSDASGYDRGHDPGAYETRGYDPRGRDRGFRDYGARHDMSGYANGGYDDDGGWGRRGSWSGPGWGERETQPRFDAWRGEPGRFSPGPYRDGVPRRWDSRRSGNMDRDHMDRDAMDRAHMDRAHMDRDYGDSQRTYPYEDNEGYGRSSMRRRGGPSFVGRGPKNYQRGDERIHDDVCHRLTRADLDVGEIEVEISDGVITLKGSMPEREDKYEAERIAASCAGVSDVRNEIRVRSRQDGASRDSNQEESSRDAKRRAMAQAK